MSEKTDDKIHLTGLWKEKSAGGVDYLSGGLGRGKLLIFKNNRKEKDTDPDYNLYLAPKRKRDDGPGGEPEPEIEF